RPESLIFDVLTNPLTHGVMWSLGANVVVFIIVSLLSRQSLIEKIQARAFAGTTNRPYKVLASTAGHDITNADVKSLAERFLGAPNVERSFLEFAQSTGLDLNPSAQANRQLLQFTERLLAGAIGASSARVVITTALRKTGMEIGDVVVLLDETSQAIRFNRNLLEATLENITPGVSAVDASQRLIGWNSRYEELMNYPAGTVHVGKSVAELMRYNSEQGRFSDADVKQAVEKRLRHLRAGTAYNYQSTFFDDKVIEIRGQPMPDGGYVTTYTDITEFKAAEAALVEAKAMLEQRVEQRTAELQETMVALQRAKAEAEDANTSKTKFFAAAAHDLLQPLNAAKLFAAVLKEQRDEMPEKHRELAGRIESGLLAVEDLLSAILDISRLDTAAPEPKLEVTPVADIFEALEVQFAQGFTEQGLILRFAKTDLCVYSDPALLRRILQNFISNARRYTRTGGVLIGCKRRSGNIAIQVIDTGIGIAAADQELVFEEFKRLRGDDKSTDRGLGLGLAIVVRIARLLSHRINMRSEIGEGSMFEVIVPRARGTKAKRKTTNHIERRHSSTSLDGQFILCIDNEQDILDGMRELLENWGARPLIATNINAAVEQLQATHDNHGEYPTILLVDYHLGDSATGVDVIRTLREHAGLDIPAIVVTADYAGAVLQEVREMGDSILHKPIKPAALRALMTRVLGRRRFT
ncbi:MAG: response regulator, partial [Desulfobulbaceae bacterium]|nr:response regulator [Desulfobulbaceae bacterium]